MAELLVVRSKIKDQAKGMNVAGDVADALSNEVATLIQRGSERAKANGRRTLQARDL
jgi:histone H3/H4